MQRLLGSCAVKTPRPPTTLATGHAHACRAGAQVRVKFCYCFFFFFVEVGFRHVGQAHLELLISSDPPALASQSAGIIGVSHCTLPVFVFLIGVFNYFLARPVYPWVYKGPSHNIKGSRTSLALSTLPVTSKNHLSWKIINTDMKF